MDKFDEGSAEFCFDPAQERAVSALRRWVEMMESAALAPVREHRVSLARCGSPCNSVTWEATGDA